MTYTWQWCTPSQNGDTFIKCGDIPVGRNHRAPTALKSVLRYYHKSVCLVHSSTSSVAGVNNETNLSILNAMRELTGALVSPALPLPLDWQKATEHCITVGSTALYCLFRRFRVQTSSQTPNVAKFSRFFSLIQGKVWDDTLKIWLDTLHARYFSILHI